MSVIGDSGTGPALFSSQRKARCVSGYLRNYRSVYTSDDIVPFRRTWSFNDSDAELSVIILVVDLVRPKCLTLRKWKSLLDKKSILRAAGCEWIGCSIDIHSLFIVGKCRVSAFVQIHGVYSFNDLGMEG